MSTGGQDLFVICKNCGSEVSPYITECPYCGNRLRKRAPKLGPDGRINERVSRRATASLPRLRRGEIPGIRHDAHPYATMALVIISVVGCLIWRTGLVNGTNLVVFRAAGNQWWRPFTAPFVYVHNGYAFVALSIIALYGTLMERRHGPVVVLALFLIGGVGGIAVAGRVSSSFISGGNGAALALLAAWAVPDIRRLVNKQEFDGDLIGTAVLAITMLLIPLAYSAAQLREVSSVPAAVGAGGGLVLGYLLARIHPV